MKGAADTWFLETVRISTLATGSVEEVGRTLLSTEIG